ncbi:hypothetical protein ASG95_00015 [Phycicoccus sp. Soil803]|nr:hypothetical protein ASG95_00015 [Phycicoccus sp. Soil803]
MGSWVSNAHPARTAGRVVVTLIALVLGAMFLNLLVTSPTLQWDVVAHYFTSREVIDGLIKTIELTIAAMVIGVILGIMLALMRMSRSVILTTGASAFIWLFRGTPLLVQIIFWYNLSSFIPRISLGIPFGPSFASWDVNHIVTPLAAALLALGLNEGAYMSEIVRAGIASVEGGQMEASLVLGMTKGQAMRRIVLPQAVRIIIPPTGNQAIGMLKGTSLVSVISTPELLYSVQIIYAQTFQTIPLLLVASIWYLILTTVLSIGQYYLERHYAKGALRAMPLTPLQKVRRWYATHAPSAVAKKTGSLR